MLIGLLSPTDWEKLTADKFEESYNKWKLDAVEYERTIGEQFSERNRLATIMRWAPKAIKDALMTGDPGNRQTWARMDSAITLMLQSTRVYAAGVLTSSGASAVTTEDAMQVDAVYHKGKGHKSGKESFKGYKKGKFGQEDGSKRAVSMASLVKAEVTRMAMAEGRIRKN